MNASTRKLLAVTSGHAIRRTLIILRAIKRVGISAVIRDATRRPRHISRLVARSRAEREVIQIGEWAASIDTRGRVALRHAGAQERGIPLSIAWEIDDANGVATLWTLKDGAGDGKAVLVAERDVTEAVSLSVELSAGRESNCLLATVAIVALHGVRLSRLSCVIPFVTRSSFFDYVGRRRRLNRRRLSLGNGQARLPIGPELDLAISMRHGSGIDVTRNGSVDVSMLAAEHCPTMQFDFEAHESVADSRIRSERPLQMQSGQSRSFEIHLQAVRSDSPTWMPWLHRDGYEATYIWTEHGCYTSLPAHEAVYLGASRGFDCKDAKGGFVARGIRVTKAIHHSNRTCIDNAHMPNGDTRPMASLQDENFKSFIAGLVDMGRERDICLHCADPTSSSPDESGRALAAVRLLGARSRTWIDHVWLKPDGWVSGCRESYACEGAKSEGQSSMIDVWEDNDIRYFWCAVYEYPETGAFARIARSGVRMKVNAEPFARFRMDVEHEGISAPWYWRTVLEGRSVWNWATLGTEQVGGDSRDWARSHDEPALTQFASSAGLYISHTYPTNAGNPSGFCRQVENGFEIEPEFDRVLERMARFQGAGRIRFDTVDDFMDYVDAVEHLDIWRTYDGGCIVENSSSGAIAGFTLAMHGALTQPIHAPPSVRVINREGVTHIVFDLGALTRARLGIDAAHNLTVCLERMFQ